MADQNFDRCANCGALKRDHVAVAPTMHCPTSVWRDPSPLTAEDVTRVESAAAHQWTPEDIAARKAAGRPVLAEGEDLSDLMTDPPSKPAA